MEYAAEHRCTIAEAGRRRAAATDRFVGWGMGFFYLGIPVIVIAWATLHYR
jgi:hypothetical protein